MDESKQDAIVRKLQIIWNNFLKDETIQKKEFWSFLFLFEFKKVDQSNLSIGTATFLNSVAFQLTTYMLQLVSKIICDSTNDGRVLENQTNHDFSKFNLPKETENSPDDIRTIISLRKFLTDGLGGPILEYLQNCDIKFLTSRKILAKLLINLYPNSEWEKDPVGKYSYEHSTLQYEILIPTFENYINDLILLRLPNFKKIIPTISDISNGTLNKKVVINLENDIFTPLKAAAASTAVGEINDDIETIDYNQNEFQVFQTISRKSDEIALLLLNLLQKLVNDEKGSNLEENSITIESLKFAIENLTNEESITLFLNRKNFYKIKLKFLFLIQSCLNNIFIKRSNYGLVNFKDIFINLIKSVEKIYIKSMQLHSKIKKKIFTEDEIENQQQLLENSQTIYEILFLIFALLNNFMLLSNYKLEKILNIFKWIDDEKILKALNVLNKLLTELDKTSNKELFFKKVIEIILQINDNIKMFTYRDEKKLKKKINNQKKQKLTINKQMHCKYNQIPCVLEKMLLKIFANLDNNMQEILIKNFQRNAFCCCLYNIEVLETFFFKKYNLNIQKQLYTFIASRYLKTILTKSACSLCDSKFKSYELHYEIFKVYKKKYIEIKNVSDMLIFLQHLLKISNSFTFDISSRILVDIVLPIFRLQKQLYTEHTDICNNFGNHIRITFNDETLICEDIDSISSLTLNIILECLNIFLLYLNDIRLIKGFFNNENLDHLNDLIYIPELSKVVCDLIRVGIDNASFLGETPEEKFNLNQRLFSMQLSMVGNCSDFIDSICIKYEKYFKDINFFTSQLDNTNKLNHLQFLYLQKKLNLSQIFYLSTIYWRSTIELYKVNHLFQKQFQSIFTSADEKQYYTDKSDLDYDQLESETEDININLKQNKLFNLAYNSLNMYLYYHKQEKNENDGNFNKELLKNISETLLYDDIIKKCKRSNICTDNIKLSDITQLQQKLFSNSKLNKLHKNSSESDKDLSYLSKLNEIQTYYFIENTHAKLEYFKPQPALFNNAQINLFGEEFFSDIDIENNSFKRYIDKYYSKRDNNFLYYIKSSESTFLFNINHQKIKKKFHKIENEKKNSLDNTEHHLSFFEIFDFALKSLKEQLPKLEIIFGNELYVNSPIEENSENKETLKDDQNISDEKEFLEETISFLCESGDGKVFLLKIFEYTFNIFVMDNFEQQEKMQQYLNKLKSLILYQSQRHWDKIENANAIIQALQTLLRVAEIANHSKIASSSSLTNESQRSIQIHNHTQYIKEYGKLQTPNPDEDDTEEPMLSGRISFVSEDIDFHSSRASCSHFESEIEFSENDTEEYYLTADEGYEADAEIQEISETEETNEKLWSSFIPMSRYRTFYVHEGICKIVIEILMELSKRCINNPNFWANSLNQLANRLHAIKDYLGGPLFLINGFKPILVSNDNRLKDFQQSILDLITDLNTPEVLSAYLKLFSYENPPTDILMRYMSYICSNIIIQPKAELCFPIETDGSISSTCDPLIFEQVEKVRNYHEYHSLLTPFTESACILPITNTKLLNSEGFTLSTWIQIQKNENSFRSSLQTIDDNWNKNQLTHIISVGTNQIMLSIYVNSSYNLIFETSKPNSEIIIDSNSEEIVETKKFKNDFILRRRTTQKKCNISNKQQQKNETQIDANIVKPSCSHWNKENQPPGPKSEVTQNCSNIEKSSLANALKNTKMAILNSFNQFNLFNMPCDPDETFESTSIELKYFKLVALKWTHLSFSVDTTSNIFNITVIIDGSEQYLISLPCLNLENLLKNYTFQIICIGKNSSNCKISSDLNKTERSDEFNIKYSLSNVLIFDKAFGIKSLISNLTALGPDALNLTRCQVGNTIPNYGLLNYNKTFKFNNESFKESIRTLKNNLVASYSVYEPKLFNGFTKNEKSDDLNSIICCNLGVIYFGVNLTVKRNKSMQTATLLSGGLSSLLFLFARIVELSSDPDIQSLALDLLLRTALHDSKLYTEFVKKDYLSLISYVIKTDQCVKDINLLRSLINNSCTETVICKRNENMYINETTTATIIYPQIIVGVLQKYCDWCKPNSKESPVLDTLLKALQYLLREKHPHQQFNMQQLNNVGFIKELLNLCKIYIVEATNPIFISTDAAESFSNLLSIFAGSPPLPSLLDEIMKLLLLLQRPSECYVTHDRSKFYFLVSPDPPIKHKKISLPLPTRQLKSLLKERKKSSPVTTTSSQRQNSPNGTISSESHEHHLSDRERSRITFSRLCVERQTTNLTNILNNIDTLEIIADCSRLSKSTLEYFKTKGKDDKIRHTLRTMSPLFQNSLKIYHSTSTNPNRVFKTRKPYVSTKIANKKITQNKSHVDNQLAKIGSNKITPKKRNRKKSYMSIQLEFMASKEYDVIGSDEFSTTNESQNSPSSPNRKKKFKRVKKNEFYNQDGIIKLQELLFLLLRDFILILPDSAIEEVLTHYVKIEILLVLANHQSTLVRCSIVRLLTALCERMPNNDLHTINKKYYWTHCANQLAVHKGDKKLCEVALQWLTGTFHSLEDLHLYKDIKIYSKFAIQSFLAILMQSVSTCDDISKCFNILKTIFEKDTVNNALLIENGLLQICVKSLHKLFLMLKQTNVKLEESIVSLLSVIAIKAIKSPNHIQILWEIMNLLSFYQENDIVNVVRGFRSVQATILKNLLLIFVFTNSPKSKGKNPVILDCTLSSTEIRARFELLIDKCSHYFIISDSILKPTEPEIKLFEKLVNLCITGNTKYSNFIGWGLLPSRPIQLRLFIVNSIWKYFSRDYNTLIDWNSKMLRSLLWLFLNEEKPNENDFNNLEKLCTRLKISENDFWNVETELDKIEINRENVILRQKPSIEKVIYKYETIIQSCVDSSMVITRIVAEMQNSERKSLMGQMKERDERLSFQEWISIVQRMTHEGAPWFNENNYPKSWELDDTEGPARVRMRLRRCELNLNRRFIMDEYYQPILSKTQPLDYLITAGDQQLNISLNSQVLYNFQAKYLPVDGEIDGEIVITDTKIFFLATYRIKLFYVNFEISKICEIWTKRYQHEECSLEFYLESNRSLFFAIKNKDDLKTIKEIFADKVLQCPDQNKISIITQQWREGLLTNWEYLMTLNHISGRTYNDLMQYPIFPWILSNYSSNILDLTDKNNFRKLEKPIAIQQENSELHFKTKNYDYINNTLTYIGTIQLKPYHYSSHYSNSGTVLHFLVRVPPFTNYFLRYQDNNFDQPDRTFHSLKTSWNLASRDSPTDVKELIPEFFYLPEIFENFEKFNFGKRQSGEIVNNVQLPPWCLNDARTFILIHRQALESEIVRNNLHNWIDLIFGYKQTGQAAIDAVNVFHPATYPEFSTYISTVVDPIERNAVIDMIKTYGQMPRQIIKTPHPPTKFLNYSLGKIELKATVKGLRWGAFTGSPQCTEPEVINIHHLEGVSHLIAFPNTNVVYGLPEKCCVMQGPECDVFNLISWNHGDRLIRMQSLSEFSQSSKPLMYNSSFDEITTCGADANSNALWFGHKSGKISIYQCTSLNELNKTFRNRQTAFGGIKLSYNSAFRKFSMKSNHKFDDYEQSTTDIVDNIAGNNNLQSTDQITWTGPVILIRHTDEVNCIALSTEYKIAVSAARDGLAVIWDLNNFNYIRTIDRPSEIHHSPISLLAISPTLGDIVTIHSIEKQPNQTIDIKMDKIPDNDDSDCFEATEESIDGFVNVSTNPNGKSILRLHSINAKYVNHVLHEEKILSVCYSYIKEGVGINVIATGIEGSIIRLWSSWDLSLVNQINVSRSEIISLTYSTYQHLIVLTKDGFLQVWESKGLYGNPPKFPQINFNIK